FYRLGDAFKFADASAPQKGLLFDGRLSEDFKLATGTWVSVGPLRARVIEHCAPFVRDVVIAGAARDDIPVPGFPHLEACRGLAPGLAANAPAAEVLADPRVAMEFSFLLTALGRSATGSSNRVCRALLLVDPPSLDRGEMTDKGSINQRAVLTHRAGLVDELYAETPSARVIVAEERT